MPYDDMGSVETIDEHLVDEPLRRERGEALIKALSDDALDAELRQERDAIL